MVWNTSTDYDAIIIGSGFSGIRCLWELRRLGLKVKCFEAGSDVGGAWYWNRYPGARTDSEAWVYAMNFAKEAKEEWDYKERYPSQQEVQNYLGRVLDRFDLRKFIEFNTRIQGAEYAEDSSMWKITTEKGASVTCRYFLPATGPLSAAKKLPFAGLDSFAGEWYQTSTWPKKKVDFTGKRVALVGTGATGVQIVPKIAPDVKSLTVFQRTPNYVLPGRNYLIDESHASEIKKDYQATWNRAALQSSGLAMTASGKTLKDIAKPEDVKQMLDGGWESGGFHFQFETLDDLFTNSESNEIASEYLRQKIRAIVKDEKTAELLCPTYPFLSKRPPCGHFYYEAFNRPNVQLVDISKDDIEIYKDGIRSKSGGEYEFDIIIFAIGFDAATGALSDMHVTGSDGLLLADYWKKQVQTFAGTLVPGFPNMFSVCGPHIPFGNMPVVLDIQVKWIGELIRHMERKRCVTVQVPEDAAQSWYSHLHDAFEATIFPESAKKTGAWFVGANIKGKKSDILFYFGGVPTWTGWLDKETNGDWASLKFTPSLDNETSNINVSHHVNAHLAGDIKAVSSPVA